MSAIVDFLKGAGNDGAGRNVFEVVAMNDRQIEETNRLLDLSREQSERYDTGATSHERGFGVSIKVTRVVMTRYFMTVIN